MLQIFPALLLYRINVWNFARVISRYFEIPSFGQGLGGVSVKPSAMYKREVKINRPNTKKNSRSKEENEKKQKFSIKRQSPHYIRKRPCHAKTASPFQCPKRLFFPKLPHKISEEGRRPGG